MKPRGHDMTLKALEHRWDAPVLLIGPGHTGKWTLGEWLIAQDPEIDPYAVRRFEKLTAEDARDIQRWCYRTTPGSWKVVLARLDDASRQALEVLLKVVEESIDTRFFFVASREPPPPVLSRCQVYRNGLLPETVCKAVYDDLEVDPSLSSRAARWGFVAPLESLEGLLQEQAVVASVLQCLRDGDKQAITKTLFRWTAGHQRWLNIWAIESTTQKWRFFDETLISDPSPIMIEGIIDRIGLSQVDPRLVLREITRLPL